MILSKILDTIMDLQGEFEFLEFNVGRRKDDYSSTRIQINGESEEHLDKIIREVLRHGAMLQETPEIEYVAAPGDMMLPDDFYCTTHHPTWVFLGGEWVEVEWEQAIEIAAKKLSQTRSDHGPDSIGVLASAKCTNEENYLFQKFARQIIGTHNVDHCARL